VCDNTNIIYKIFFLLKYSCVKTLLLKYRKLRRFRKIFNIFGLNLIIKDIINNNIISWFPEQLWINNIKILNNGGIFIYYITIVRIFYLSNNNYIICINCNSFYNIFLCKVILLNYIIILICFICLKLLKSKLNDRQCLV
jgi:hypothetical protein